MVQVSRRTGFTGSALIRLLARLTDIEVPEPRQAFADRLSQWLGWTDAISLSAALNGAALNGAALNGSASSGGLAAPQPGVATRAPGNLQERECERVRAAMANAIAQDLHDATRDASTDFAAYRRRYHARQQAMQSSIGPLRGRMRATLAARSAQHARLAAVDVVMEQVLGAQEQRLFATVPALLEKHFGRLRRSAAEAEGDADVQPAAWLAVFRKDMHDVLLAEMEIRFQPVEGLLEALRTS